MAAAQLRKNEASLSEAILIGSPQVKSSALYRNIKKFGKSRHAKPML
jgi:hypothetical protein